MQLPFLDRSEAGHLLGRELAREQIPKDAIVLALPRGGVQVGLEVAEALKCPLDILSVRKLGVPSRPELAMGAIAGDALILDYELIRALGISRCQVDAVISRERSEMQRRESFYRGDLPVPELGRTVMLVDDGLATGLTMIAATRHARSMGARKVIVAAPVGSANACARLAKEADACICLAQPRRFNAVGEWYRNFQQLTDTDVREMLPLANRSIQA